MPSTQALEDEIEMIWLRHKNVFSTSLVWYSFRGAGESTVRDEIGY